MSCIASEFIDVYYNNDLHIEIDNLRGYISNVLTQLNSATGTYQIYDLDDTEIDGATGSITAVGSGGDYYTDIDKSIINLLDIGSEYRIQISGSQSGADFEFNVFIRVKRRGIS